MTSLAGIMLDTAAILSLVLEGLLYGFPVLACLIRIQCHPLKSQKHIAVVNIHPEHGLVEHRDTPHPATHGVVVQVRLHSEVVCPDLSRGVWGLVIGSLLSLPPCDFILIMILTLNRVSRLLHKFLLILCLSHLLQRATWFHRHTCRCSCRCSGRWCCRRFRRRVHAASCRVLHAPGAFSFSSASSVSFHLHFADFDTSFSVDGCN
ncbi:hypothetical protein CY34DRAFT_371085 [Suillus luteus UH-Slu-Lm8-n1]|uniref:Uncharacterized protein n=1 Tax=Suillus luteus UH-Slu-Lm8-n1 TaxID=930992 RepID=A0A0D0AAH2_9AGAM|nr:hypothetical protein CY34DRAFT_371085 [Suillus luteus UH-Slu-Lm8-n1]